MPSGVSYTVSLLLYSYSPSPRKAPLLFTLISLLSHPPSRPARHLLSLLFYLYSHIPPSPRKAPFIFTLLSLLSHPPLAPQGIFYLYSYIFTLTSSLSPRKAPFIFTLLSLLLIDA